MRYIAGFHIVQLVYMVIMLCALGFMVATLLSGSIDYGVWSKLIN